MEAVDKQRVGATAMAKILGCSRTTIYAMVANREIPFYMIRSKPVFDPEEVLKHLRVEPKKEG